jgi:hypothetical protein
VTNCITYFLQVLVELCTWFTLAQVELNIGNVTRDELVHGQLTYTGEEGRSGRFTCKFPGIYPVLGNCSSYYKCIEDPSQNLIFSKGSCYPNNFDPTIKQCSELYRCSPPNLCNIQGFLCNSLTSFVLCSAGSLPYPQYLCPRGYYCHWKCNNPCTNDIRQC